MNTQQRSAAAVKANQTRKANKQAREEKLSRISEIFEDELSEKAHEHLQSEIEDIVSEYQSEVNSALEQANDEFERRIKDLCEEYGDTVVYLHSEEAYVNADHDVFGSAQAVFDYWFSLNHVEPSQFMVEVETLNERFPDAPATKEASPSLVEDVIESGITATPTTRDEWEKYKAQMFAAKQ
jgi:hypothetical protein